MADKQVTFSIKDSLEKLKKSLDNVGTHIESEINQSIKDAAYSAYATIVAKAQAELHGTRQDYLKGLDFQELGEEGFLITLDGDWANKLEDGYASYDLRDKMLASNKIVGVGKRSGQPWVQHAKPKTSQEMEGGQGHKFAHVPFERKPFSKQGSSNLADGIKQMQAQNMAGKMQKITSLFKDIDGNPLEGKVAIAKSDNPLLDGLVKYQKTYTNEAGKKTTQSIYVNYRTVSEAGKPWIHPGFKGLKAFEEAEKQLMVQIDNIIKTLV